MRLSLPRTKSASRSTIGEPPVPGKATVNLARKAYELAQLRYKTGLGSLTELRDAELAFTEAKLFLSKTLRDVNLHLYKIRSYLPEDARSTS